MSSANGQGEGRGATVKKVFRTELSPVSFLERSAAIFSHKIAIVHGHRCYSYLEFYGRVNRLASALRCKGLKAGDRVAFLAPNIPPMLEAHFGVPAAGGVLVPINIRLKADEVDLILRHSGSRFLFIDREFMGVLRGREVTAIVIPIDDSGVAGDPYEDFLATGSPSPIESGLTNEEDSLALNYTPGTTGIPKGVMYSHRGAYLNALGEVIEAQMSTSTRYLWTLPMFHCNGWCCTWAVTAVGGTHVCLRRVDPAEVWRLLTQDGITHFAGAPTVHTGLVNHPSAQRLSEPVQVMIAGAPPSPTLLGRLKELNFSPLHVYGLTEVYGPHTVCTWDPIWNLMDLEEQAKICARQGQAYVIADLVRVVDGSMNDVPKDGITMGEVVMRGNNVMTGYFQQPDETAEAFRGGWFHSGDLGVWHENGYIELRDRKKDIIISGGENISTIEVEQTIMKHPAVMECAVVAFPDQTWGERPKAFVSLKPGAVATEQEIIGFCREHLAHFKAPAAVEFSELPKTSTGKVQKFALREQGWAGHAKRIN